MNAVFEEFGKLGKADQESFWVLAVNNKNRMTDKILISIGGATSCDIDPKIIFRRLLSTNTVSFICVHNHPSGDPEELSLKPFSWICVYRE